MRPKRKETTVAERKIILHLHSQQKSYAEIGEIMGRSRFTIRNIIKRFAGSTNLSSKKHTGRPRVLSVREEVQIVRKIKKNPRLTSTRLAAEVKEEFGKEIHPKTIRRTLHRAGYKSRVARRKPLISKNNKKKRLSYAQEFRSKGEDFWNNVLFSDESKFNIFQSDGKVPVWRKPNTAYDKNNTLCSVKHGGGGVMVWGCMASSGVGELVFIDQIMNKTVYLNILKENVKKSVENLGLSRNYFFQHDNDPKHTAHDVRMWIAHNIPHVLPHPPQSPDLNPIEHLWEELEKLIRKHNISNKNQLKEILCQEWKNIGLDITKKLVHSMPRRLDEVIKQRGYATKY